MAALSISIARGLSGFKKDDFVVGTSAPGAGMVEVRIADDSAATRLGVMLALEAVIRQLQQRDVIAVQPPIL